MATDQSNQAYLYYLFLTLVLLLYVDHHHTHAQILLNYYVFSHSLCAGINLYRYYSYYAIIHILIISFLLSIHHFYMHYYTTHVTIMIHTVMVIGIYPTHYGYDILHLHLMMTHMLRDLLFLLTHHCLVRYSLLSASHALSCSFEVCSNPILHSPILTKSTCLRISYFDMNVRLSSHSKIYTDIPISHIFCICLSTDDLSLCLILLQSHNPLLPRWVRWSSTMACLCLCSLYDFLYKFSSLYVC